MNQLSFGDADFEGKGKTIRKERFPPEMKQIVPWQSLVKVVEPFYPDAGNGRRP